MAKVAIVFWSETGHTETMANCIAEGLKEAGSEVELFRIVDFGPDKVDGFDKFAFGCPAKGSEELEPEEFEPGFTALEEKLKGKQVALFGSYEWAGEGEGGEWMRDWVERCKEGGIEVFEGKGEIAYDDPSDEAKESCKEFGKRFAS